MTTIVAERFVGDLAPLHLDARDIHVWPIPIDVGVNLIGPTLPQLEAEGAGAFDLVFIDADKPSTPDYFAWALRLTRAGSLIVVDNVVRKGAVADPDTGLAVYDTFGFDGWLQVGGTSLATPIVASIFAMAGGDGHRRYASDVYRSTGGLYDVTSGANGDNCDGVYLCTAVPGYDGPTGLGTPAGISAF